MSIRLEKIELMLGESFRLLRWNDNVRDVEIVGPTGEAHPYEGSGEAWHYHPEMELTLVTHGSGTRFVGDAITSFRAPDLLLLGDNVPHHWHGLYRSSGYAVQFSVGPEHPFWRLQETQELQKLWADARRGIHVTGDPARHTAAIIRDMQDHTGMERLSLFISALATLARAPGGNYSLISKETFVPSRRIATYEGIRKAITFALNNFQEELSIEQVLQHTGMSRATFSRQFKKHTGKTFTRFVNEVRISSAGQCLIETDQLISEIAFASGFNNLSHFNHLFRELRGYSPREFRDTMKAEIRAED
jgi:AraC-like DNA-binding protein